jgi:RNA polymerase sigma factor (sigma-70 family)
VSDDIRGSVTAFFQGLRAGNANAAEGLWERFVPRLLGLARKTLAGRAPRGGDADDVVLSAFASFWQRATRGDFGDDLSRNDLWNLLGVITVRKARKHIRREQAQRRGGGRVIGEHALAGRDGPAGLDELVGEWSAAEFDLHCEELLLTLDDETRTVAVLRLMGHKNREIAEILDCTERKVERKLNLIRQQWEAEWPDLKS